MGIRILGSKRLMFYGGRRGYLTKVSEILDKHLTDLTKPELDLVQSVVFPVDRPWFPTNQLERNIVEAIEVLRKRPDVIEFYEVSSGLIKTKLDEWNELCKTKRPEFVRKVEGVDCRYVRPREVKEFGSQYYQFVCLCCKYKDSSILKIIKETIREMAKKKWQGVITPKVCLALLRTLASDGECSGSKLKEMVLE